MENKDGYSFVLKSECCEIRYVLCPMTGLSESTSEEGHPKLKKGDVEIIKSDQIGPDLGH